MNLKDYFLTSQRVDLLLHIYNNEETYNARMQSALNASSNYVTDNVTGLEERGLAEVGDPDPQDNRKRIIDLTERGEELAQEFERLLKVFQEVEKLD